MTARQSTRRVRRPYFHAVIILIALATAFYATFLPTRASTRASGITDPASGLSYSGAVVAQVQPETLSFRVEADPVTKSAPNEAVSSFQAPEGGSPSGAAAQTAKNALNVAAPAATPDPLECDDSVSSLYCVYTIQEGDTLSGIAGKTGLKSTEDVANWELLVNSNKPDITSEDDLLQVGQKIRIPKQNGVIHLVTRDQTLSDVADQYGVTVDDIVAANGLADADSLTVGQELLVPNPTQFKATAPVIVPDDEDEDDDSPGTVPTGPRSRAGFVWPVAGPISSYFGPSHPLGIDIDLYAAPNAPIAAAGSGTVTFAGGNSCCSYGLYVIIDHGNGFQTLYAHLSRISVSVGQKVSQGQVVGLGGRTGYATGNHLHFEVHLNGAIVNPTAYLP